MIASPHLYYVPLSFRATRSPTSRVLCLLDCSSRSHYLWLENRASRRRKNRCNMPSSAVWRTKNGAISHPRLNEGQWTLKWIKRNVSKLATLEKCFENPDFLLCSSFQNFRLGGVKLRNFFVRYMDHPVLSRVSGGISLFPIAHGKWFKGVLSLV